MLFSVRRLWLMLSLGQTIQQPKAEAFVEEEEEKEEEEQQGSSQSRKDEL